jgi:hypothetical protein
MILELTTALMIPILPVTGHVDPLQTWTWLCRADMGHPDPALQGAFLNGAARGNGQLLVVGERYLGHPVGTTVLAQSLNSGAKAPWIERGSTLAGEDIRGIMFANEMFLIWGASGLWTSIDGMNWAKRISDVRIDALACGQGRFAGLGTPQTALSSIDGLVWEASVTDSFDGSGPAYGLAFGKGQFIAVSTSGGCFAPITNTINRSSDALTWTRVHSEVNYDAGDCGGLRSVAFGRDRFVAVGGYSLLVSTNGLDWSRQKWQGYRLDQIIYGNGQFVAAAGGDNISPGGTKLYTSRNGIEWTRLDLNFDPSPYGKIGFADGYFTCVGEEMVLQSGPIIDVALMRGLNTSSLTLSLEGPSGLGYAIQSSQDLITWHDVTTISNAASTKTLLDGLPAATDHQFYRVLSR